nr:glycoside hydrolase family 9 protein [Rhodothermus marinus]MBO2492887.1 glycoside hydrolase [Rhodothermus marinus]
MRRYLLLLSWLLVRPGFGQSEGFVLNEREYFEREGVSVMVFQDFYPEGHQSGVTLIQHGERVAANGDVRLEATPGQWQPVPRLLRREVHPERNEVVAYLAYPDPERDRKGFNPIFYPDLHLTYRVRVRGEADGVRIIVDLDEPLPEAWAGRVGFNLELFPGALFGKSWYMDDAAGIFPRQPNGPVRVNDAGEVEAVPLATGRRLLVAPESDALRLEIESLRGELVLYDGRVQHDNGWFVVRTTIPAGVTTNALEWVVRPHVIPGWRYGPVLQVSQVGYHPRQPKVAVLELDARDDLQGTVYLLRLGRDGATDTVLAGPPVPWNGRFLRYRYAHFDFSHVTRPGLYVLTFRDVRSHPFRIAPDVYQRHVWQPTLEFFLPVQMCHMRVEQQYRVWHGACHLDDARMAPPDTNHIDGYVQGPELRAPYAPGEHVPGLNVGGWHDAGDNDLRIESQADEVFILATMYELFDVLKTYDNTTINQRRRLTQIHQPDGRPDVLQQIEHGVLSILGGYRALGRLYRGIIAPTLKQYVLIGDPANSTDNRVYDPSVPPETLSALRVDARDPRWVVTTADDRWVFTESNPAHEYKGIAALAAAGRVLRAYNPELARACVEAAEALWQQERDTSRGFDERVVAAVELFRTTGRDLYRRTLLNDRDRIVARIGSVGWAVGTILPALGDSAFTVAVRAAVARYMDEVHRLQQENPYGVPYRPRIWGAGWDIQRFGVRQYLLHRAFPDLVPPDYVFNALNFVLGVHPGRNTAAFASGVGARSVTVAYGFNRADWTYIPGGVVSGTALIRPDFPELKEFPYLWQQVEYVMGGGATHFMFLVLAADQLLNATR